MLIARVQLSCLPRLQFMTTSSICWDWPGHTNSDHKLRDPAKWVPVSYPP